MNGGKPVFYSAFLKRLLDFLLALIALIILSPVFFVIFLLVRKKHGVPVIFKQKRPGKDENIFQIMKFRTMTNHTNSKGELLPDRERITKLGKFLRSTSLDEIPSLLNILKGDMSFVGPRPLSVKYLPYYNDYERKRHSVRPGLTGLAQINGRNKATWEQRFEYDIHYIENVSCKMDLKVIYQTIKVVIKKEDVVVRGPETLENFHEYRIKQLKKVDKYARNR